METTNNYLTEMFERQEKLQERLGTMPFADDNARQEFINIQTLALLDEVLEALRETPWKPWKKTQVFAKEEFKEEFIDAFHFLINLSIASGMDSYDVYRRYCIKNKINHKRQDEGY